MQGLSITQDASTDDSAAYQFIDYERRRNADMGRSLSDYRTNKLGTIYRLKLAMF